MQDQSEENDKKILDVKESGYVKDSDYYFDSYSHFSIHEQMLKDGIRTKSYMGAILENPHLFQNKIVLDVGSGTGILSIFAGESNLTQPRVERNMSMELKKPIFIHKVGPLLIITIIHGLVEEVQLPVQTVDIIISQWMGYFLLYESMFDSVLYARNKWLHPNGIMMPNRAKMYIAALDDEAYYMKKLNFWDNVYGVSMKCIKKWVLSEPIIDPIQHQDILTTYTKIYDIDLRTVKKEDLQFNSIFNIKVNISGRIHGFVCWFDCIFSHGHKKILLSTSPYKKSTHWKQTVFYINQPLNVAQNDQIKGEINVVKAKKNHRQLNVMLAYAINGQNKPKQYYHIS